MKKITIVLVVVVAVFLGVRANSVDAVCTDPNGLIGNIISSGSGGKATARLTNNSSCTQTVGFASYKMFMHQSTSHSDLRYIDAQELYDDDTTTLSPGESASFQVNVPSCKYQLDLFQGRTLTPPYYGGIAKEEGHHLVEYKFVGSTLCGQEVNIPKPDVTITADDEDIPYNTATVVRWTSHNATSCTASGGANNWAGSRSINGSFGTGKLTSQKTYTITCRNNHGDQDVDSVTIEVGDPTPPPPPPPPPPPAKDPIVNLTVDDNDIPYNTATIVRWTSQYATSCTASEGANSWAGNRTLSGNFPTGKLTQNTTYTITCRNSVGSDSKSVIVRVGSQEFKTPIVTLTADDYDIPFNTSTVVRWTSTNASTCMATNGANGWTGTRVLSGNFPTGRLNTDTHYTITCTNNVGSDSKSITVEVGDEEKGGGGGGNKSPIVTLTADDYEVPFNTATIVRWTSQYATSCTASGGTNGWGGARTLAGSFPTGNLTSAKTYNLTCSNSVGSDSKSITVTVSDDGGGPLPDPTVDLTADDFELGYNESTNLRWESENATSCTGNAGSSGWAGSKVLSGLTSSGKLKETTTFNITCRNAAGKTASDSVKITVGGLPPPGDPMVEIFADDTELDYNGSTNIRWTSENVTTCTSGGGSTGWAGTKTTAGVFLASKLKETTTFNITCRNAAGRSVNASVKVTVGGQRSPTVSLFADKSNVPYNGSTNIRWTSENATICTANGGSTGWANPKTLSGIFLAKDLKTDTTFNITCRNAAGEFASASEEVTVGAQETLMPSVSIFADDESIPHGSSTNVRWESENATSCKPNGGSTGWLNPKDLSGIFHTGSLIKTTTYNITCRNAAGQSASASVIVQVDGQPGSNPTVTIFADDNEISKGGSTNIRFTSTNAIACTGSAGSNGWAGNRGLAGIHYTAKLTKDTTYNITCRGNSGAAAVDSVTVMVSGDNEEEEEGDDVTVNLTADDTSLDEGDSTILRWTSENADTCTGSGGTNGWTGSRTTSGSFNTGDLDDTETYTITCRNDDDSASDSITIDVDADDDDNDDDDVSVEINADDDDINYGSSTTVRWDSDNADSCRASDGTNGWSGNKSTSGSFRTGSLTRDTTFTIECENDDSEDSDSVTVQVNNDRINLPPIPSFSTLTAITTPATNIGDGSAQINALILNTGDESATTWFDYGTSPSLGSRTNPIPIGAVPSIRHANTLTGLSSGVTYYFRAVAENSGGRATGSILSFRAEGGGITYTPPSNTSTTTVIRNNTSTSSTSSFSGGVGRPSLVMLTIDGGSEILSCGETRSYNVEWENVSNQVLTDVVLRIILPRSLTLVSANRGSYSQDDHTITMDIGTLDPGDDGDMFFVARLDDCPNAGELVVVVASLVYTDASNVQNEAIAYATHTAYPGSYLGANALFGLGFFPNNIFGWLLLLILILILILLVRQAMGGSFYNRRTVVQHTPYPAYPPYPPQQPPYQTPPPHM